MERAIETNTLQKVNERKIEHVSGSESIELKQDKEMVEVKLVVAKRLGNDEKELKYISCLSGCEITIKDQVHIDDKDRGYRAVRRW